MDRDDFNREQPYHHGKRGGSVLKYLGGNMAPPGELRWTDDHLENKQIKDVTQAQ